MAKGIIFDIKRFAVHDGPGIRTTVFFKGCPLECAWCHNPESRPEGYTEMDKVYKIGDIEKVKSTKVGKSYDVVNLIHEIKKDLLVMEESDGGVTVSGGEPLLQFDFLKSLLKSLKEEGIHTCVDTSGYANGNRIEEIIPYTDLFLYDLKHYNEDKHLKHTGVSLKPIMNNLKMILNNHIKLWIRIPIIPNVNDNEEDRFGFLYTLQSMPEKPDQVHLLPYHNIADAKYKRLKANNEFVDIPSMDKDSLKPFKRILERAGFKVKLGG
jgi:pyruvate formate lyase activating enzyme